MPSGDAACGAVVAYSGYHATGKFLPLWILIFFCPFLGRVIFRAHHILDVSIGALWAFIVFSILKQFDIWTWSHERAILIHLTTVIIFFILYSYKLKQLKASI